MVPDSIEREVLIEAPVDVVWRVLTEPEHINEWFTDAAELDARPGGAGTFTWHERAGRPRDAPFVAHLRVTTADAPHYLAYRWSAPDGEEPVEGNSTLVEFTLTAEGDERTRLRCQETGIHAIRADEASRDEFHADHSSGWTRFVANIAEYAPTQTEALAA